MQLMESEGSEEAVDITRRCERRTLCTESCLFNVYGSPVVVRGQRREEDVSEPRSVVTDRVERTFNFSFILRYMLLFARFFPFQFLTKTNKTELS